MHRQLHRPWYVCSKNWRLNIFSRHMTHLWIVNDQCHGFKFTSRWWSSRCSCCRGCCSSGGRSPWCWPPSSPPTGINRTENESNKKCSEKFHFFIFQVQFLEIWFLSWDFLIFLILNFALSWFWCSSPTILYHNKSLGVYSWENYGLQNYYKTKLR